MGTNHKTIVPLSQRLIAKLYVHPKTMCWVWTGGTNEHGYGIIGLGTRKQGVAKAHRVSWEIYMGAIPPGMNVLHKCDNPPCCNPDHLYLGTLRDNARDMVARGRDFRPDNRGEKAAWAKLCKADVEIIKKYADNRPRNISTLLAKRFGCSRAAIYQIWAGRNWANS